MHQVRFFDKDITLGVQAYYKDESITFRGVQMKLHLFRQFFCVPHCIHFNQAETIYSPQSINDKLLVLGKTCAFYSKHGLTLKEKSLIFQTLLTDWFLKLVCFVVLATLDDFGNDVTF